MNLAHREQEEGHSQTVRSGLLLRARENPKAASVPSAYTRLMGVLGT